MFHRLAVQVLACCEAGRGVKVGDVCEPGVRRAEMEDVDSHAIGIEKRFFSFCSWRRLKEENVVDGLTSRRTGQRGYQYPLQIPLGGNF